MGEPFFSSRLLASPSFQSDLRQFFQAGDDAIRWINEVVERNGSFELTPEVLREGLSHGFTSEVVSAAWRVSEFLYDHARHKKLGLDSVLRELTDIGAALSQTIEASTLEAAKTLLSPKSAYDRSEVVRQTRLVGPPLLQTFLLAVDARAMTEGTSEKSLIFVPLIIGRASVSEGLTEQRSIEFRVSEDQLREIREDIDKALHELELIKEELGNKLYP